MCLMLFCNTLLFYHSGYEKQKCIFCDLLNNQVVVIIDTIELLEIGFLVKNVMLIKNIKIRIRLQSNSIHSNIAKNLFVKSVKRSA